MIIKRIWLQGTPKSTHECIREGWYLFGFIPLYIRDMSSRERRK